MTHFKTYYENRAIILKEISTDSDLATHRSDIFLILFPLDFFVQLNEQGIFAPPSSGSAFALDLYMTSFAT